GGHLLLEGVPGLAKTRTIAVESAVGHGTTFVVTLPVVQGPPRPSRRRQDAGVQPVSAGVTGSGRHS
ncbi:MAG TPA: hypothetical protein VN907_02175, partial [Actinomycetes bacterium]|nr:hypothetical protein [Actinomycetes bacterium]